MLSVVHKRIALVSALALALACSSDGPVGPGPDPVPVAVAAVTLDRDTATIVPGASVKLAATATGGGQTLNRTVTWSSSDNTKATVGTDGSVTGVSAGSASITATSEGISSRATITILDGGLIASNGGTVRAAANVVTLVAPANAVAANTSVVVQTAVNPPAASGLIAATAYSIAPAATTFAQPVSLTIKYSPSALGQIPRSTLALYSLNNGAWQIVPGSSVDSANAAISAPISKLGTYAIIGSVPPAAVASITPDITSLSVYSGITRIVSATLKDANGNVLAGRTISWTSSNNSVASVTGNVLSGAISAGAFGLATITASVEGKSAAISVSVKHDPIIFVHGFASSGQIWGTMINSLVADGWVTSDITNWSYDPTISNVTIAGIIKSKVDSISSASGAPKVDIISHSMGGLSSRYYSRELGGSEKLDAWVSLGGPNHGTTVANFCGAASCLEMRPGSAFLTALNQGDETPGTPRYATWWSPCDEATTPNESVILSGANNTQTACIGHSALYQNTTVYGQVRDWIK